MSLNVTFNGSNYIIPETGETGWGGNTTSYLVAIAAGALQKTGGSFTLSAETDFGASFGLKSLYYKSRSTNIATAGILRLNNNSDSINWRNAANSADLPLAVDSSNRLTFNGQPILTGVSPTNYVSSIIGTADQVIASSPTGNVTLSLPQSINLSANVRFGTLGLGSNIVASSILSLTSTTEGFLPPRMTTVQRDAIVSPATGLFVYNTTTGVNNYYNGSSWLAIAAGGTINPGNSGYFSYYPANGTTLDDQSVLYTDGTNIGVGITLPVGTLHIKGGNANNLVVDNGGQQYTEINLRNNGTVKTAWYWDQTNNRSTFIAPGSAKFLFTSDIIASAAHHAFGVNNSLDNIGVRFTNTFISPGGLGGFVAGLDIDPTMTGGPGDTAYQVYVNIAGFKIETQPAETVGVVASLQVKDPQIIVGAGGTVDVAALIYCDNVPTEGTVNAAIYVNSGSVIVPSGSSSVPVITTKLDTNTGLSWTAADRLGVITGGTVSAEFDNDAAYFRNGTTNAPSVTAISDDNTGWSWTGSDVLIASTNGIERLRIDNSSVRIAATTNQLVLGAINTTTVSAVAPSTPRTWTIPDLSTNVTFAGLEGTQVFTGLKSFSSDVAITSATATAILIQAALSGNILGLTIDNTSNTASSDARQLIRVAGTSAGDAFSLWSVSGTQNFSAGIDNSTTNDNWVLSHSSLLGTNNAISVDGSSGAVELQGSTTNNSAASGKVGEYIESLVAGTNAGATDQFYDITSISLTAGDWDVTGVAQFSRNGATYTDLDLRLGISTTSGNSGTGLTNGQNAIRWRPTLDTGWSVLCFATPSYRLSLSSTTTVYLKGYPGSYSAATPLNNARLSARRVR